MEIERDNWAMKIGSTFVLFLLGMLTTPVSAKTPAPSSARQAIQAAYSKMDRADDRKDESAYMAFFDRSFIHYEPDGSRTDRATYGMLWKGMVSDNKDSHTKTTIVSITPRGKGMVVVRHTVTVASPPPGFPAGSVSNMTLSENDRDYWIMSGGIWKILQERRLPDSSSISTNDGK